MYKAIVIGTSFGGLEALTAIIKNLPENFSLPILVVLHIGEHKNDSFITALNKRTNLHVKEADEKEKIQTGTIYFAPPNYHLLVDEQSSIALSSDPKINHSRPSIDALFESAAWHYKNQLIGILLTGLNQDGALGIKEIQACGGTTIVENPETAIASIMPASAIRIMQPDFQLVLNDIPSKIRELTQ
ncbi:chemotaxis protein CheB [Labilibaculum sp.]|uniref:chemotaxis protein CheB n=1 Tax=Labilibaculum sp. TaxID=2060723 RepID=UPI003563C9E5